MVSKQFESPHRKTKEEILRAEPKIEERRYEPERVKNWEMEGSLKIEDAEMAHTSKREELIESAKHKAEMVELKLEGLSPQTT